MAGAVDEAVVAVGTPRRSYRELAWRRLRWFGAIVLAGWVVALLYHWVLAERILRWGGPWSAFLMPKAARFSDLLVSWEQAKAPNPYLFLGTPAPVAYFPITYQVLSFARGLGRGTVQWLYVAACLLSMALAWWIWWRGERGRWAEDARWPRVAGAGLAFTLLGYPLVFAVDRGNFDPLVAGVLAAAVGLLWRGGAVRGGVLLGLAAAPKGYALAALIPWARRRQWPGILAAVATFAALFLLPAASFEGGLSASLAGLKSGVALFRERYVLGIHSAHYSADWLNGIRVAVLTAGADFDAERFVRVYEPIAAFWAGLLALHALLFAGERWRELLGVVLVMLVFPNVTNDYKLVLLVPVILAWLASPRTGWRHGAFGIAAALLLVPKHFWYPLKGWDASSSCLVSPVLLLVLTASLWPTAGEVARARGRLAAARERVGALRAR